MDSALNVKDREEMVWWVDNRNVCLHQELHNTMVLTVGLQTVISIKRSSSGSIIIWDRHTTLESVKC